MTSNNYSNPQSKIHHDAAWQPRRMIHLSNYDLILFNSEF